MVKVTVLDSPALSSTGSKATSRLGGSLGGGRQGGVHLGDLDARARTGVPDGEGDFGFLAGRGFQRGVSERGVGEAVAEGEQRRLVFRIEPLVADLESFLVWHVEGRHAAAPAAEAAGAAGSLGAGRSTWRRSCGSRRRRRCKHLVVYPIGLAPGERQDGFAGRGDIADQNVDRKS